jgi:hypothetical protein
MMKICQHQHKGKPHTQEKYQDAATSMEDAITVQHTSGVETSCVHMYLKNLPNSIPSGCRVSSGWRGILPITCKRAVHIMGPF